MYVCVASLFGSWPKLLLQKWGNLMYGPCCNRNPEYRDLFYKELQEISYTYRPLLGLIVQVVAASLAGELSSPLEVE